MPNYIFQPQSNHTSDLNDLTNAVFAFGVSDPGTVSGLTNGTAYVAREIITSPASAAFTPAAVMVPSPLSMRIGPWQQAAKTRST